MIKALFYKNKILKTWSTTDEESLKQWVIKTDTTKMYDKDIDAINKAKLAVNDILDGKKPEESNMLAYINLRKKYKGHFKENNKELENPTSEDVLAMDNISLEEIDEVIVDRKKILNRSYFQSIIEIFRSERGGTIIRPTSGGLYKSKTSTGTITSTPTSDFIDDLPQDYNPSDDNID
jgi:hypothetical protein